MSQTLTLTYLYLAALCTMVVMTTLIAVATPYSAHKRNTVVLFVLVTLWCLADLLSNLAASAEQVRLLAMVFAPVWIAAPPFVLGLATRYTGGPGWLWRPAAGLAMLLAASALLGLVWSGALYSLHLPAAANGGAFASRASHWQLAVVVYEAGYVLAGALIMLRAARREGSHALRRSALFTVAVMAPLALLAVALNSNFLPAAGDAPHTASLLLALTFLILGVGMLRRDYFAPIDVFRHERDRARDQLLQREQVLGAMPLGVAIAAQDLRTLLYCNPPFRTLLELGAEQTELPAPLAALLCLHAEASLRPGCELEWRDSTSAAHTLLVHAHPVEIAGRPARLLVLRDLTAQKKMEAELEDKRAQLAHAQKMEAIGRLSTGIAHDFNNQLTAIQGNAVLMARGLGPTHPLHGELDDIRRAAERATVLTRQLLSFGRKREARPAELELNALAEEEQRTLGRLLGPDIELRVERSPEAAWAWLDRAQLEQVLMTLAANARDAMPGGGTLRLAVRRDGEQVVLEVGDSGVGMTPEVQARLFEPFFTTKGEQGTGLGLATARDLVTAAGGQIAVRSTSGQGATFELRFPAMVPAPPAREATPPPVAALPDPSSRQRHLLLVDDEDLVRRATRRLLTREGFTVLDAGDGPSALRLFDAATPPIDVVLTDLAMPGMDGRALADELRLRRPALPLVFMSGHQLAGQSLPGNHLFFVAKPFAPGELLAVLERALAGVDQPAASATTDQPTASDD